MSEVERGSGFIIFSFFIALMLMIFPLPEHLVWIRPQFTMLVLIYWVVTLPHRIGVATGWCVGLLMDVLMGGLLGEYALGMSFIAYFAYRLHARIRMFPMFQQMFCVLILVGMAEIMVFGLNYFNGEPLDLTHQWLPIVTTTLCWPIVYILLNGISSNPSIE